MCRAGGPYCYLRNKTPEQAKSFHEKRIRNLSKKFAQFDSDDSLSDKENEQRRIERSKPEHDSKRNLLLQSKVALLEGDADIKKSFDEVVTDCSSPGGGFTVSKDSMCPQTGFFVSPYEERSKAVKADELNLKTLKTFIKNNDDLLAKPGHYFGGWHDPDSGLVYLDVSIRVDSCEKAREVCDKHDQKAFFDLQTFQDVLVNKDATSGQ